MRKLIYGIGINDAGYKTKIGKEISGKTVIVWECQVYKTWVNMLQRCYSESFKTKRPTYSGCFVHPKWLTFSNFKSWMECFSWEGMNLDKDILFPGNKMYGPDTCVFITRQLNGFLTDRSRDRGEYPLGVCLRKDIGKFQAHCSNPWNGKNEGLGVFDSKDEAHNAWRKRKHQHASVYADMQEDQRIAEALRVRFSS